MAEPLTLSARMYQTKPAMSTGGYGIMRIKRGQISPDRPDHEILGGNIPTCVTCPIFRPGRGGPLP
jgi:hypothetical protein